MGISMGILDFREPGPVVLRTVKVGKQWHKIGNSQVKQEAYVEIAVEIRSPHGS